MMFSALIVENAPYTVKRRLRDRVLSPAVTSGYFTAKGGTPFKIVRAFRYRGEVPWYSIAAVKTGRMLLPDGEIPPEDAGIKKFVAKELPSRLLVNSAFLALKQMDLPETGVCLTLFDDEGNLVDIAARLVLAARYLRIVTPYPQKYEALRRELLRSCGVSLVVTDKADDSAILTSTAIISSKSKSVFCRYKGILFTNSVCSSSYATVMRGRGIELDSEDSVIQPPGIDPVAFACALYECCGVRRMGDLCYEHVDVTVRSTQSENVFMR